MYEYRVKIIKVVDGDTVDVDIDLGLLFLFAVSSLGVYGIILSG